MMPLNSFNEYRKLIEKVSRKSYTDLSFMQRILGSSKGPLHNQYPSETPLETFLSREVSSRQKVGHLNFEKKQTHMLDTLQTLSRKPQKCLRVVGSDKENTAEVSDVYATPL